MLRRMMYAFPLSLMVMQVQLPEGLSRVSDRARAAESGVHLVSPLSSSVNAQALAEAMDVDGSLLLGAEFEGNPAAAAILSEIGVLTPRVGSDMTLLSTGIAGSLEPEPGSDFEPIGVAEDTATLTLRIAVPQGRTTISFEYLFLSAESPEFVGEEFNDAFTASVRDADGERRVVTASVNNSSFIEASDALLGGTGFDIFSADPEDVDRFFGTGLPDAGYTPFQRAQGEVQSDGEIVVEFSIRDEADGILDSAVLIDNLHVSSLEVLDPNETMLEDGVESRGGGRVTTDEDVLATQGDPVRGIVADGVTRLVLRASVAGPGTVTFDSNGTAPEDGGFAPFDTGERLPSVTAPVFETAEGFFATCIYRAPDEFDRGSDGASVERQVRFRAAFQPETGNLVENHRDVVLLRPPLVLVHGLWSRPQTWRFPLVADPRFRGQPADYSETHAGYFRDNDGAVAGEIVSALIGLREDGIAATQADVIGHSMGGILSRLWIQNRNYRRVTNFFEGDIRKLFTLDTPHSGSPLANLLVAIRETPILGSLAAGIVRENYSIDPGAVDDLSVGSPAIAEIQRTSVPGHALVGVGGSQLLPSLNPPLKLLSVVVDFFSDTGLEDLFQGVEHDVVVPRESQEGGAIAPAYTVVGGDDGIHIGGGSIVGNTGSIVYSEILTELIDTPATSPFFWNFPAPSTLRVSPPTRNAFPISARGLAQGALSITFPEDQSLVQPGQILSIAVLPSEGLEIAELMVVLANTAASTEGALEIEVTVPEELIGPIEVRAVGKTPEGDVVLSDRITLTVEPTSSLEAVRLHPRRPILFGKGQTLELSLEGSFADGVTRDLTDPVLGTEYLVSDPTVLEVSGSTVNALSVGAATVVGRHSGLQDSVTVEVLDASESVFYIFADDFESGDLITWSLGVPAP